MYGSTNIRLYKLCVIGFMIKFWKKKNISKTCTERNILPKVPVDWWAPLYDFGGQKTEYRFGDFVSYLQMNSEWFLNP